MEFVTNCGHKATAKPVLKKGGPYEGKWLCRVIGPKGLKTLYSDASVEAARARIARFIGVPPSFVLDSRHACVAASSPPVYSPPVATSAPPIPVVSPERRRPFDVYEASPNRLATCRKCIQKIQRGVLRVGIQEYYHPREDWSIKYYHKTCLPDALLGDLYLESSAGASKWASPFSSPAVSAETKLNLELESRRSREEAKRRLVFDTRGDLREELRQLRLGFAKRLGRGDAVYLVFDNKTLDDLVLQLPTTTSQLLKCKGMGGARCRQFGPAILQVILQYKKREQDEDAAGGEDCDVRIGEVLTIDQIIDRKLKEAELRGQVFAII
ncbi:expressed unknown protein [Seminavis robusta]|uniref:DNA helicase n=1 Tax=Seminavis robusta TaxID=568900 RepID=A0A9N8F0M2_9STRA|nr:expressed unknown protein [Seminavis robusta]|eukprot:Sro2232_g320090.1 n/a (326) ;mRNA; f:6688-7665